MVKMCPRCGGLLGTVRRNEDSLLNPDQFDSVRAGDYFCSRCPDNGRGISGLCYWWEHELPQPTKEESMKGRRNVLEVGFNEDGEVVINHPRLKTDENGVGHIVFSPLQARNLAQILIMKAEEAEALLRAKEVKK